jgi:tRNA nucleotidyltransferase (CCA-adding enzyme)
MQLGREIRIPGGDNMDTNELFALLAYPVPSVVITPKTEELFLLIPELKPLVGLVQNHAHSHDGWGHTLATVDAVQNEPVLRLAALLHDVGKPPTQTSDPKRPGEFNFIDHDDKGAEMCIEICRRLNLAADISESVRVLVLEHMRPHHLAATKVPPTDHAIRRLLKSVGPHLWDAFRLAKADSLGMGNGRNGAGVDRVKDAVIEFIAKSPREAAELMQ